MNTLSGGGHNTLSGGAWAAATLRLLSNRTLEYETATNAGESASSTWATSTETPQLEHPVPSTQVSAASMHSVMSTTSPEPSHSTADPSRQTTWLGVSSHSSGTPELVESPESVLFAEVLALLDSGLLWHATANNTANRRVKEKELVRMTRLYSPCTQQMCLYSKVS